MPLMLLEGPEWHATASGFRIPVLREVSRARPREQVARMGVSLLEGRRSVGIVGFP